MNYEVARQVEPHAPGPLRDFARNLNRIQALEEQLTRDNPSYSRRVRVSVVTARNAPAHERAVLSLKEWGVRVNDAFFLGGVDKGRIISVLKPHIFFDDQPALLQSTASVVPSVHVPFGVINAGDATKSAT